MSKVLYVVRHGKATGQQPDAALTAEGEAAAVVLADVLADAGVERIVSSPYRRAIDSIGPLAQRLGLAVATDERLIEAELSRVAYPDWLERLKTTFDDDGMAYEGGESSRDATARAKAAVESAHAGVAKATVIVTHGRLMTLLLRSYDRRFGFDEWRELSNPDVYKIMLEENGEAEVVRVWK
jgi:2,3-bisphosphoglycerate-dependent phosphoglycerate mutase